MKKVFKSENVEIRAFALDLVNILVKDSYEDGEIHSLVVYKKDIQHLSHVCAMFLEEETKLNFWSKSPIQDAIERDKLNGVKKGKKK